MFGSARLDSHEVAAARLTRLKERKVSKLGKEEKAKHAPPCAPPKAPSKCLATTKKPPAFAQNYHWALSLGPKPRRFVFAPAAVQESWKQRTVALTSGRKIHWTFHRAAPRAVCESLHQPRTELQLPLLFHAQTVVRADRQGADRFPGGFGTMDELWK